MKGEVHSIWDLWISGLQECKGNGFFEVGRGEQQFSVGLEISKKNSGGLFLMVHLIFELFKNTQFKILGKFWGIFLMFFIMNSWLQSVGQI